MDTSNIYILLIPVSRVKCTFYMHIFSLYFFPYVRKELFATTSDTRSALSLFNRANKYHDSQFIRNFICEFLIRKYIWSFSFLFEVTERNYPSPCLSRKISDKHSQTISSDITERKVINFCTFVYIIIYIHIYAQYIFYMYKKIKEEFELECNLRD